MKKHSLFESKRFFYVVLLMVIIMHILTLAYRRFYKISIPQTSVTQSTDRSLKVKVIGEKAYELLQKKQIVDSEDSDIKEVPNNSRFLSDKNRIFDRQTRARKTAPFEKAGQGNGKITLEQSHSDRKIPKKDLKDLKLSDLGAYSKNHDPFKAAAREYAKSVKGMKNGSPLERSVSSSNDYLKDIPAGDFTHLNTNEYKYYGFYHRVKQKLEQFWSRTIQEKAVSMQKAGRRLPASEIVTSLKVTMDADGNITAIKVTDPSGIQEMDEAAIESFNQAGPFPNPPKGLIVDGKVIIEWGFVVNT